MTIEKIYFSATDGVQLFGLLHKSEKNEEILVKNLDVNNTENERNRNNIELENKIKDKMKNKKKVVLSVHGMTSNCFKKREEIFAEEFTKNGIDYFSFNNRGADIVAYFERVENGKLLTRIEGGSAYEKFEESYYDIKGALQILLEKGYEEIYLQGHSYGAAKSVYTYNKLKENMEIDLLNHIKFVTLLSIVDIPRMCRGLLGKKYNEVILEIKQMINENKGDELIKREYFLHPITANNFLYLNRIGGPLDLVSFGDENPNFVALNNIECPLLMLYGKERDLLMQKPEELEQILRKNVNIPKFDIKFIEETGHNYRYKERETAQQILGDVKLS